MGLCFLYLSFRASQVYNM